MWLSEGHTFWYNIQGQDLWLPCHEIYRQKNTISKILSIWIDHSEFSSNFNCNVCPEAIWLITNMSLSLFIHTKHFELRSMCPLDLPLMQRSICTSSRYSAKEWRLLHWNGIVPTRWYLSPWGIHRLLQKTSAFTSVLSSWCMWPFAASEFN